MAYGVVLLCPVCNQVRLLLYVFEQVTVCFMGDGTTNMGQFYEAMNMAALMKLPIVFVVENNNW